MVGRSAARTALRSCALSPWQSPVSHAPLHPPETCSRRGIERDREGFYPLSGYKRLRDHLNRNAPTPIDVAHPPGSKTSDPKRENRPHQNDKDLMG